MSSTFGTLFKTTTFGESHGQAVGAVVEGCPANISLRADEIQAQLDRRRPGQSELTTSRKETDRVKILSGVENDRTLGTPIALMVANKDQKPGDYGKMRTIPRPSHADYTYHVKYANRSVSGGGRASARETIGRVAAGSVAEKILAPLGMEIVAWVHSVGDCQATAVDMDAVTREKVDVTPVRCPDQAAAEAMIQIIRATKAADDSVGGVIACVCRNVVPGLGEPVFGKLEALLAQAMLSIPATKGFEIGSGFQGTCMRGSVHNDLFIARGDRLGTRTNNSGGVQGGISNGEPIFFKVAFKPVATIGIPQATVDFDGNPVTLAAKGRHDPCVVPRAVPIVESMTALVLADLLMIQKSREALM
jgi:chorismate synthase